MNTSIDSIMVSKSGGQRRFKPPVQALMAVVLVFALTACHVQFVSPFSVDLQKKASDMLSDVVAWESHMRGVSGTAAADPRHPDVQAKLAAWRGDIEAMAEVELSIDPGSTACDAFLSTISGRISSGLKSASSSVSATASSEFKPVQHCETLPGIFTRMTKQVTGDTAGFAGIPFILDQQCELPWLPDGYFTSLQEGRATVGAPSAARPTSSAVGAGKPTTAQQADAVTRCRSLFVPPDGAVHGVLVDSLTIDLAAIIYREGRQSPPATK